MLRFKCWYYDQAIQDGSEDRIKSLLPDHLPDDIQPLYDHAHQEKERLSQCSDRHRLRRLL